jgi:hypothetical protein
MPLRRRPLMRAAMVGGAGYAVGKRRAASAEHEQAQDAQIAAQQQPQAAPPQAQPPTAPPAGGQSSETERIEALTKLKSLLDSGVLTQEQYESERQRLTEGM